jgi:hypothetical protein
MARSQAQSDFSVTRPALVRLPRSATQVALPRAIAATSAEASEFATRWILRLTLLMLAALALLCAVGPHIPTGE